MAGRALALHPVASLLLRVLAWGLAGVVYRRVRKGDAAAVALVRRLGRDSF